MNYQIKTVFFDKYSFLVYSDVYEPAEDTFLLARNLNVKENDKVLDVGTGCGILAVLAAEKAAQVVAVDINPYAVACAKENAEKSGVAEKIDIRLSCLFEKITHGEKFDLILFNAPYLPVGQDEGKSWIEKAWAAGDTGRKLIDNFIHDVSNHLGEDGRILLVQSSLSGNKKTLKLFSKHKLRASIVDEEKVPFEKIVIIEATWY